MGIIDIESIIKDFYNISGIRVSIYDTEFNEIYSYPTENIEFCKCLQQNKKVLECCRKNDLNAFEKVKTTKEIYLYKCKQGLLEAIAPIYHYGEISGYVMIGKVIDTEKSSIEYIINRAEEILCDSEKAKEISNSVKTINRKLIYSYINIITNIIENFISTNNLFLYNGKLPQLIKEYINKNFSNRITLSILSQKFECCNATLTKSFKKEYNLSIMSYLSEIRLKKAEEMIIKTRKSFKEIAVDCGFYDQNYFSKVFAKKYDCSPSEYRKLNIK